MARRTKITYQGREYESIKDLAAEKGISPQLISTRIAMGWEVERAVETPPYPRKSKIEYKGREYESKAALAREAGITISMFHARSKKRWRLERIVKTPNLNEWKNIEYDGHAYKSLREMARSLGLAYPTLKHYMSQSDGIDSAMEKYRSKMNEEPLTFGGAEYSSYADIARRFGFDPYCITLRMQKGMTLEESVKDILNKESVMFEGKRFESLTELGSAYKVQPSTIMNRILKCNCSLEDAVFAPLKEASGIQVEYDGISYKSQIEICREYSINVDVVRSIARRYKFEFIDAFDLLKRVKEAAGMRRDDLMTSVPAITINGHVYYDYRTAIKAFGIDPKAAIKTKRLMKVDMIETLKAKQGEMVGGEPKYPKLSKIDLSDRCLDVLTIYKGMLADLEETKREAQTDIHADDPKIMDEEDSGPELVM